MVSVPSRGREGAARPAYGTYRGSNSSVWGMEDEGTLSQSAGPPRSRSSLRSMWSAYSPSGRFAGTLRGGREDAEGRRSPCDRLCHHGP